MAYCPQLIVSYEVRIIVNAAEESNGIKGKIVEHRHFIDLIWNIRIDTISIVCFLTKDCYHIQTQSIAKYA